MGLLKKKCAHCGKRIEKGKEVFSEVKIPEFKLPKIKTFCSEEHYGTYLSVNKGTPSKKPYCMNCDD
jgi:hypothetical protein